MIEIQNAVVCFNKGTPDEHTALRDVSVQLAPGEFITLIGSNGAGKSTLFNLLAGDVSCDEGQVLFDNSNVTALLADKRAPFVSRVFQDPHSGTCAQLSIEENLALALRRGESRGLRPALTQKVRAEFALLLSTLGLGLEKRLRDSLGSLSGGQRQAVSLLMATLRPSKLLLLDEHTAALDPKMAEVILTITKRLVQERKLTTIMITHNMKHALELGDRTLVMHHGRIVRDLRGPERSKLTPSALVDLFG